MSPSPVFVIFMFITHLPPETIETSWIEPKEDIIICPTSIKSRWRHQPRPSGKAHAERHDLFLAWRWTQGRRKDKAGKWTRLGGVYVQFSAPYHHQTTLSLQTHHIIKKIIAPSFHNKDKRGVGTKSMSGIDGGRVGTTERTMIGPVCLDMRIGRNKCSCELLQGLIHSELSPKRKLWKGEGIISQGREGEGGRLRSSPTTGLRPRQASSSSQRHEVIIQASGHL